MHSLIAPLVIAALCAGVQPSETTRPRRKSLALTETEWLSLSGPRAAVGAPSPEAFVPIDLTQLPLKIQGHSDSAFAFRLHPEACPLRGLDYSETGGGKAPRVRAVDGLRVERYVAQPLPPQEPVRRRGEVVTTPVDSDAIRYTWQFDGVELQAVHTINGVELSFALEGSPADRASQARRIAQRVVKWQGIDYYDREYDIKMPWPAELRDGDWLCSAPDKNVQGMFWWTERVDAFVERGRFHIIMLNSFPKIVSFLDGRGWFAKYESK